MNRNDRGVLLAALCSLLTLLATLGAHAQLAAVRQEVPDNLAMHPAPEQPIPYSHRVHLALGLSCETCHQRQDGEPLMGFPATGTCMTCHTSIARERPAIQELAAISASGEPVPWVRVYEVLPGVSWSHEPHIGAGVQCGACHGDVAQLDTMAMTTSVTAMASCISCHEAHAAATACATCHAWPAE